MMARVFRDCKMAASTVYKHRVLDVAILHPGNTHAVCPDLTRERYAHNTNSSTYVRMVTRAA